MEQIISDDQVIYSMNKGNKPVLQVKSGTNVVFETCDCFENQITSSDQSIEALEWGHINPATGPLYVEDAEPGDTLKVEIVKIEVGDYGVMAAIPDGGLLGDQVKASEIKIVPIENKEAVFSQQIRIPIKPMIGVIGVAPRDGMDIPCGIPDSHGGNMDNKKITQGTTLYLPIYTEGGLLAIGDLHANMGDGEIMVTGVEISGRVEVKVEVVKGKTINNPILEDDKSFYTIASKLDLLDAVKTATNDMHQIVMNKLNLSFNEAGMLLSAIGDVQVCQVVDPNLTVRFAVPKSILNSIF